MSVIPWLLQEAVSQIKPLSDEYLLHPGAASDPLPDIENEDKNPPPLMMPSPPDTSNPNSTSSFLNLLYEVYGVQLQNAEANLRCGESCSGTVLYGNVFYVCYE